MKGTFFVSFLVFASILWVIASCSTNSTPEPNIPSSNSTEVIPSSSSHPSSSSEAASSSSSIVASSSSSEVADSSSSEVADSSSSEVADSSSSEAASSSSKPANAACSATRTKTTIQYIPDGTSGLNKERHVLDLTLPSSSSGNGPFPLVIFLHGGGFTGGSKADVSSTASNSAPGKGYALASIGYRLSGQTGGTFPGSFNDILTAIRFLRANADKYCLDPDRFAVTGFSAGAYHAGMICVLSGYDNHDLDGWPTLYQGFSNKVQACVTYAALSDMAKLDEHEKQVGGSFAFGHGANSPESGFLGINTAVKDAPETPPPNASVRWKANPINYITTKTPPIYMLHGSSDNVVPWVQSDYMTNEINKVVSGRAEFVNVSGATHSGFSDKVNDVFNFLDKNLK